MPTENAKAAAKKVEVKKEEDDDDEKCLNSMLQGRKKSPTNAATLATKSRLKDTKKVKKEEDFDENDDFEKPIVKGKVKKGDENGDLGKPINGKPRKEEKDDKELNKRKRKKEAEKKGAAAAEQNGKKREKKVYDLPGQKRDPPEERDPLRIFYETLYKQVPSSEMAQIWMMESGLLSKEEAKKVYEKKQKKNPQKLNSPMKAVTTGKKNQSAPVKKQTPSSPLSSAKRKVTDSKVAPKQPKKRKIEDGSSQDNSDEEFLANGSTKKKQRAS